MILNCAPSTAILAIVELVSNIAYTKGGSHFPLVYALRSVLAPPKNLTSKIVDPPLCLSHTFYDTPKLLSKQIINQPKLMSKIIGYRYLSELFQQNRGYLPEQLWQIRCYL